MLAFLCPHPSGRHFPGGDAHALYASTRRLLSLPPTTRLFMCHDYPPDGRAVALESTVPDQRASDIHVHDGVSEQGFVAMRTKRDATLEMPVPILPAVARRPPESRKARCTWPKTASDIGAPRSTSSTCRPSRYDSGAVRIAIGLLPKLMMRPCQALARSRGGLRVQQPVEHGQFADVAHARSQRCWH